MANDGDSQMVIQVNIGQLWSMIAWLIMVHVNIGEKRLITLVSQNAGCEWQIMLNNF